MFIFTIWQTLLINHFLPGVSAALSGRRFSLLIGRSRRDVSSPPGCRAVLERRRVDRWVCPGRQSRTRIIRPDNRVMKLIDLSRRCRVTARENKSFLMQLWRQRCVEMRWFFIIITIFYIYILLGCRIFGPNQAIWKKRMDITSGWGLISGRCVINVIKAHVMGASKHRTARLYMCFSYFALKSIIQLWLDANLSYFMWGLIVFVRVCKRGKEMLLLSWYVHCLILSNTLSYLHISPSQMPSYSTLPIEPASSLHPCTNVCYFPDPTQSGHVSC